MTVKERRRIVSNYKANVVKRAHARKQASKQHATNRVAAEPASQPPMHSLSSLSLHDKNVKVAACSWRHSPNVSTIILRLFLLQFFPKPIWMHQILPNVEKL
jgi:hypothetical protein